jgi:hypothetical protein
MALAVLPARFLLPDKMRIFILHLTTGKNSETAAFAHDYSTVRRQMELHKPEAGKKKEGGAGKALSPSVIFLDEALTVYYKLN